MLSGSRRGIGVNEERDQTLNQLLTELDGFEGREGVLLLAATNRAEVGCVSTLHDMFSLTHSPTHSLTHPLTHPSTHPPTHSLTHVIEMVFMASQDQRTDTPSC